MNRNEINKYIHEKIAGKCWHDFQRVETFPQPDFVCTKCDSNNSGAINPDYCSDDSPRSLLNEVEGVVVQSVGAQKYADALQNAVIDSGLPMIEMALAQHRSRACVEAHMNIGI